MGFYVRKSWIGSLVLAALTATAVTYKLRPRPDYTAEPVPEIRICRHWTTAMKYDPGDFQFVDCRTGAKITSFYLVGGHLYQAEHGTWDDYGPDHGLPAR